jgi:hypothetical protein
MPTGTSGPTAARTASSSAPSASSSSSVTMAPCSASNTPSNGPCSAAVRAIARPNRSHASAVTTPAGVAIATTDGTTVQPSASATVRKPAVSLLVPRSAGTTAGPSFSISRANASVPVFWTLKVLVSCMN